MDSQGRHLRKILIVQVFAQQRLRHPREVFEVLCWELRNPVYRQPFVQQLGVALPPALSLVLYAPGVNRLVVAEEHIRVGGCAEQLLVEQDEHFLVVVLL